MFHAEGSLRLLIFAWLEDGPVPSQIHRYLLQVTYPFHDTKNEKIMVWRSSINDVELATACHMHTAL
jgi:hypothetical protein